MARKKHPKASCATLLKGLANETRLSVVRQLMKRARHVGEINAALGVDPTLLSHHLKVLRETGLVVTRREGRMVLYSLAPEFKDAHSAKAINLGCCLVSFK